MSSALAAVLGVGVALAVALVAARCVLLVATVEGTSMTPTLRPGQRLLVIRRPWGRLRRGAIVVLRLPPPEGVVVPPPAPLLVKRLGAVAGEPVPASVLDAVGHAEGDVVPPGAVVLLADAGGVSGDSRTWGFVPAGAVRGRVVRVLR